MARLIRKCENCGALDSSRSWTSLDEATKDGAFEQKWTCSTCAWTESELVEESQPEPARSA